MESQETERGVLDAKNAEMYPVQDALLGGEYPAGRRLAPQKQREVVEVSVQEVLLGREYPTGREPQPSPKI